MTLGLLVQGAKCGLEKCSVSSAQAAVWSLVSTAWGGGWGQSAVAARAVRILNCTSSSSS